MIRSLAARNLLSVLLLAVSVGGIATEISLIHAGRVQSLTRLTLAAYIVIAIYAAASIAIRFTTARRVAARTSAREPAPRSNAPGDGSRGDVRTAGRRGAGRKNAKRR